MKNLLRQAKFPGKRVALFATASYTRDGERMFAGMAYALEKKARRLSGTAFPGAGRSSSSTGTRTRQWAREKVRTCGACLPDQ
jgi:hypothetical protein